MLLRIEAHKSALILRYKYGKSADPVKLAGAEEALRIGQ